MTVLNERTQHIAEHLNTLKKIDVMLKKDQHSPKGYSS